LAYRGHFLTCNQGGTGRKYNEAVKSVIVGVSGLSLVVALLSPAGAGQKPAQKIDFNRDVRPIIGKCMTCHGPDNGEGVAGLRLDSLVGATKSLPSGKRAIVPGKPEESELVNRIHADDYLKMPPESSNKTLSEEEKRTLVEWIRQGAEYKEHWAFVKPVRPPLPRVDDGKWPKNGIDYYVLAALEAEGLSPEKEADRRTLIRRLSLDITGLPPTITEVEEFVNDKSVDAYEKVVDRLLASPRYGERMAMDWMDYARYADSNGYQADYERYQWRWRDWVIDAFNDNMPYDQFTVEQLAGDMLPNATMEQRLATGFNRNHRINTEGGVIAEEWRVETVVDRVETTSAVWLGLTSGCARCHDHKYDPLTQKDFYRMFAYFNNVPESGSGVEAPVNHPPLMDAPTPAQSQRMSDLAAEIKARDVSMANRLAANDVRAEGWKPDLRVPIVSDGLVGRFELTDAGSGFTKQGPVKFELGRATGAVATTPEAYLDFGNVGDFERDKPFSFGAWVNPQKGDGSPFSKMDSAKAFRGWECSLNNGMPQAHIISTWPQNAIKIASDIPIPNNAWTHLFFTYDGSSKAAGFKMYVNGKFTKTFAAADTLTDTVRTPVTVKVGRRTNTEPYAGMVDDLAIFGRELGAEEVALLASTHPALALLEVPVEKRSEAQKRELVRLWSLENDSEYAKQHAARIKASEELAVVKASVPNVMVMQEMPQARECFVLERGLYDKPAEKVEAGLPSFLPPMPEGVPNNRLGFARWIVSDDNPLTARVTVNRLWERFFGTGIVETVEDFGTRAAFPSHPELLDWLATEFVRLDWNLKAMVKTIVMSATYQQSSIMSDEKLERDPENRLLSRGPRFRLQGEVIRDQALFVSGLLVERLGGKSVYPYMPEGVWDETNFYGNLRNYKHATDENAFRRSLYTIWKRTAAPPNMLLFDVPGRETCRVRRARTDTPLQALALMNDETYVEAARVLAQRMIREGGKTSTERLTFGFEAVLARKPTPEELAVMEAALARRLAKYRNDPEAARALIYVGESRKPFGLDWAEVAAYTVTASTLLNLDEAINKE
jgi:hypothetical protein